MTATTSVADEQIEAMAPWFLGDLVRPGEPSYDEARQLWNGMFDRHPALVAMCEGTADVIDAVNFAQEHGLRVAVRGGAHSVAGYSSVDDGVMINLSRMRGVWIDHAAGTVRVEGGATWGDVDRETQAFGLVAPGGVVSDTGVAGLTLGGGIGWVRNKYGLSCDNLLSAEVVTADGRLVTASPDQNEELFWGLRGGGGNFGIVTSFEFGLRTLGPEIMAAITLYSLDDGEQVLRGWRDFMGSAPEEITSAAIIWTVPADPPGLPPPAVGKDVVIVAAAYAGAIADGERETQPLRALAEPIFDMSGPMPFRALQMAFDPFFGVKGTVRSYWKSLYLPELSDASIDTIARHGRERPSPWSVVNVPHFGPKVTNVGAEETAFGRRWPFMVSMDANAKEASVSDEQLKTWARDFWSELQQLSGEGLYLNFLGEEESGDEDLVRLAYGANYDRLKALKQQYDPTNLFSQNQNIAP
jgi:FAD/FMN-containing dehydrogenase